MKAVANSLVVARVGWIRVVRHQWLLLNLISGQARPSLQAQLVMLILTKVVAKQQVGLKGSKVETAR